MQGIAPVMRIHLWLETDEGMVLGMGRAEMLRRIQECGSLNLAAKSMGMSYRAAWGRLKATEAIVGEPLVERAKGHKGFVLSPLGRQLLEAFRTWQDDVEAYALRKARETMPWPIKPFDPEGGSYVDGEVHPGPDT